MPFAIVLNPVAIVLSCATLVQKCWRAKEEEPEREPLLDVPVRVQRRSVERVGPEPAHALHASVELAHGVEKVQLLDELVVQGVSDIGDHDILELGQQRRHDPNNCAAVPKVKNDHF